MWRASAPFHPISREIGPGLSIYVMVEPTTRAGVSPRCSVVRRCDPRLQRFPGQPGLPKLTELGQNRFPNVLELDAGCAPRGAQRARIRPPTTTVKRTFAPGAETGAVTQIRVEPWG